jgi:hypothetical protein
MPAAIDPKMLSSSSYLQQWNKGSHTELSSKHKSHLPLCANPASLPHNTGEAAQCSNNKTFASQKHSFATQYIGSKKYSD